MIGSDENYLKFGHLKIVGASGVTGLYETGFII